MIIKQNIYKMKFNYRCHCAQHISLIFLSRNLNILIIGTFIKSHIIYKD